MAHSYSEFDSFCLAHKDHLSRIAVHLFGLEVILTLRENVPPLIVDYAAKRKAQIVEKADERNVLSWRLACWDFVAKRSEERRVGKEC